MSVSGLASSQRERRDLPRRSRQATEEALPSLGANSTLDRCFNARCMAPTAVREIRGKRWWLAFPRRMGVARTHPLERGYFLVVPALLASMNGNLLGCSRSFGVVLCFLVAPYQHVHRQVETAKPCTMRETVVCIFKRRAADPWPQHDLM